MREIKFRAWDKKDKVIRKVVGMSFYHESVSLDIEYGRYLQDDIKRFELMQYTGLKDKNGVDIYEGDVVKGDYYDETDTKRIIGKIEYNQPEYKVNGVNQYEGLRVRLYGNCEVIGNIHEHQHLLGGVDK